MLADKWNDPLFLPFPVSVPDLSLYFSMPIPVPHKLLSHMQLVTVDKDEERWQ